jgi:hypothetical protein
VWRSALGAALQRGSAFVLLILLVLTVRGAGPVALIPKLITLPVSAEMPWFVDVDGDGRAELLVIDQANKTFLNYHQRADGFADSPDQVIPLPLQTAWVAPCDVDAPPGLELLMSSASGLVYSRQNAGLFESERHPLIQAIQVFTNFGYPVLTLLSTNRPGTNDLIPVITAQQVVPYHRNMAYEWSPGPALPLVVTQATWSVRRDGRENPWALGPNPGHELHVSQTKRARPLPKRDEKPENDTIRKIMDDMKRAEKEEPPHLERVDVNGDGREDLVLWQLRSRLPIKTDIYIFLAPPRGTAAEVGRGAGHQWADQPTQVLHCRGLPLPTGSAYRWTPLHNLNGDGIPELVLLEFKTSVLSVDGLLEIFLTHGLDWLLTVRTFHDRTFSPSPVASLPATGILPAEVLNGWTFLIQGDFNGDGRPDFLIRRSDMQWNVFFSTTDGRWFEPQAALKFDSTRQGYMEFQDLDGDGLTDIIWHDVENRNLAIYMTPRRQSKGKTP